MVPLDYNNLFGIWFGKNIPCATDIVWGVKGDRQRQGNGMGYPGAGGWETIIVGYQIVGGSKGIAIK